MQLFFGKRDLMASGLRILLLKWTWYLSNGMCMLVCLPVYGEKEQGACLFQ